jgi:membrane protease YdiL (CAAX protease family)
MGELKEWNDSLTGHYLLFDLRGRLVPFLLLTFALSWGFDLAIALTIGHPAFLELGLAPWSMFVPASVALALQLTTSRNSPIHFRHGWDKAILIPISFLVLTVLHGIVTLLAIGLPSQRSLFGSLGNLLTTLWTLALFTLYGQVGADGFRRVDLPLGNIGRGFKIALGVVAFLLFQSALNLVFGLGAFPGIREQVYGITIPQALYPVAVVLGGALAMTGTPLAGLAPTFGEEVAWRGVLLSAWRRYGVRRAAFLSGLVWGVWHLPIILAGIHTYPPTFLGLLLALVFFVLWGMVQSYAVLKTGSIWVASFLHGLVNSVYAFGLAYLVHPEDKIWSFGLGLFGLLCLAPIVLLLLRDPVWQREHPTGEEATE